MEIGMRLKKIRESKGFTQIKLSKLAGVSNSLICDIEAGRVCPSMKTLFKLAKALEIGVELFFVPEYSAAVNDGYK